MEKPERVFIPIEKLNFYAGQVDEDDVEYMLVPGSNRKSRSCSSSGGVVPCPFCGHAPCLVEDGDQDWRAYHVFCENEDCVQPGVYGEEVQGNAIAAWNTRTPAALVQSDHDEIGLALFRQLVCSTNALRQLDVFGCNDGEHAADCKCFWEQCETWAAEELIAATSVSQSTSEVLCPECGHSSALFNEAEGCCWHQDSDGHCGHKCAGLSCGQHCGQH